MNFLVKEELFGSQRVTVSCDNVVGAGPKKGCIRGSVKIFEKQKSSHTYLLECLML